MNVQAVVGRVCVDTYSFFSYLSPPLYASEKKNVSIIFLLFLSNALESIGS